ncbi:HD domain-containing protein [uncultured Desulfosarcina sp.]|uniref:HD domain-containing protein n=1 Tax=uncultured Desulfosarcina sp. TaxID=218289 RepID=UPI0029C72304|nr:HD domain-containing protein [uncultured Desulfosarcina sp.]
MKIIDALYGPIDLRHLSKILNFPELQRLREVRLCNVNSPYITGGSNLNRFEHAIGTAYLAQKFSAANNLTEDDDQNLIIASLLHDIVTPPFGHSLEYLFDSLGKTVYEHAQLDTLFSGKTVQYSRPFFLGNKSYIVHKSKNIDTQTIFKIIKGTHELSKYLSNNIDVDNIDNVYRFAYHIGIKFDFNNPCELATSLKYTNDELMIKSDSISLFENWFTVRKKLYKYLLENEGEFVAKALLERTFIELVKHDIINEFDWILTDYELILKAINEGNATAKECISKYMLMNFPTYHYILQTQDVLILDNFLSINKLNLINNFFSQDIFIHFIRDVNKTCRPINVRISDESNRKVKIGHRYDRYLIGLFCDNPSKLKEFRDELKNILKVDLIPLQPNDSNDNNAQISLF